MNKRQLIDDIRRFNMTAEPRFLAQFEEGALRQYLEHLQSAQRKHTRPVAWSRRPESALKLVS